jgi:hypothetical protein
VRILLTGASGIVGTDLAKKLRESNFTVVPLTRCSLTGKYLLFQNDLQSIDLIVHAGLPDHPRTRKKRREYISNTLELFQMAKLSQTHLLFISSHSSRADNPTQYSRDKNQLEKVALEYSFSVLRIGIFAVSDNFKQSLVIRWLKIFGSSTLKYVLEILPSTNSENIQNSIKLIQFHDHKIWECFTTLRTKVASEGKDETTISPYLRAINIGDFNQKKWLVNFIDLVNNLTFSFIDPILNLLYDLRYYAK